MVKIQAAQLVLIVKDPPRVEEGSGEKEETALGDRWWGDQVVLRKFLPEKDFSSVDSLLRRK
jgi:hypothetical protein